MATIPTYIATEDGGTPIATEGLVRTVPTSTLVSEKISIMNSALIATGNNPVQAADDSSSEWIVASEAYERAVETLLYAHNWKFAKQLQALTRIGDSEYPGYADKFVKPNDCMFLVNVWRTDLAALIYPDARSSALIGEDHRKAPRLDYRVLGDLIHTVAPAGATCEYVPFPVGGQPWSVGFREALRLKIEAACYRALNNDTDEADRADKQAMIALQAARSRSDSEEKAQPGFTSGLLKRRKSRRVGFGWW